MKTEAEPFNEYAADIFAQLSQARIHLSCPLKCLYFMAAMDQRLQITTISMVKKTWDPYNDHSCHLDKKKLFLINTKTNDSKQNKTKQQYVTDSNPLLAIFNTLWTFCFIRGLLIDFSFHKSLHLIQLKFVHRKILEQNLNNLPSFIVGARLVPILYIFPFKEKPYCNCSNY